MKTHVRHRAACCPGYSGQSAELVNHISRQFSRVGLYSSSTEAQQVWESHMSTNVNATGLGHTHCLVHEHRVTRVVTAGNVGRGDKFHERVIVAHAPGAEAFAQV